MRLISNTGYLAILTVLLLIVACSKNDNDTIENNPETLISANETNKEPNNTDEPKTHVPDDSFEQYLIDNGYDDILDDYVLTESIDTVKSVDLTTYFDISDLTGLENFELLKELSLVDNAITSVDISLYKKLESLYIQDLPLTELIIENTSLKKFGFRLLILDSLYVDRNDSLEGISGEDSNIKFFSLSENPIILNAFGFIDIAFGSLVIKENERLKDYFCNSCSYETMVFSDNPNFETIGQDIFDGFRLESLTITNNPKLTGYNITDFKVLRYLNIKNNAFAELDVSTNIALEFLDATDNPLECIQVNQEQLDNIPAEWTKDPEDIYSMDCKRDSSAYTYVPDDAFEQYLIDQGYDTVLDDYVLTENIATVQEVSLDGFDYEVSDLTGLEDFEDLTNLSLKEQGISTLEIPKYRKLKSLTLTRNRSLKELCIDNSQLETLRIFQHGFTDIHIINNKHLQELLSEDFGAKKLTIKNNPVLGQKLNSGAFLDFFDAIFTELIIENNPKIEFLTCNTCPIEKLNIRNNQGLRVIDLDAQTDGDRLSSLSMTDNPNLESFKFSEYVSIVNLDMRNNAFQQVDVSTNSNLKKLDVSGNPLTCVKVNQTQLNDIPSEWIKDDDDIYSLNCP